MILGSKPLSAMTEDELRAGIAELQSQREALRAEAIAKKQKERETGVRQPAPRAAREPKAEDPAVSEAMRILMGG